MAFRIALVGNPNCGKTTMFNEITGSTQYVGNWPGVTVEKKEGKAKKFKEDIKVIDLPGIYSLSPYSLEEIIARDYIVEEKPDVVINIVDATNIERNLYLTTQLLELGIPVVVALNIIDEVEARGDSINTEILEKQLGIPVVPTVASKCRGINEVMQRALQVAQTASAGSVPEPVIRFDQNIENCIQETISKLTGKLTGKTYNPRWVALKLLEDDQKVIEKLGFSGDALADIKPCREALEKEYGMDMETIIADSRYKIITGMIGKAVKQKKQPGDLTTSDKIDSIVTNRILAIPLFLALMYAVFQITFGAIGSFTIDWVDVFVNETVGGLVAGWLEAARASEFLMSLVLDGIIAGVGGVLVFVPQIMILFFFISILEDSGYMARAAFVMDRMFRRLGLSGKSFIPMILGFGCSVPAVMAARTLENEKDKRLTIILTPFMSCGARLPVYALFAAAFFAQSQGNVIFSIYILGIVVAILSGIILKNTVFKGETAPFVMELPPYRIPTLKGLLIHMWDRGKAFMIKAGTIIFAASVVIWLFQTFSFSFEMVDDPQVSILGVIGTAIAPLFSPLGFGEWQSAVAIFTGLLAKEVVVATMGILYGLGEVGEESMALVAALQTHFTPLKAYAFMAFVLLYMPCFAAFAAAKRELNSWKWALFAAGYQTGVAWIVALLIFQVGRLMGFE